MSLKKYKTSIFVNFSLKYISEINTNITLKVEQGTCGFGDKDSLAG